MVARVRCKSGELFTCTFSDVAARERAIRMPTRSEQQENEVSLGPVRRNGVLSSCEGVPGALLLFRQPAEDTLVFCAPPLSSSWPNSCSQLRQKLSKQADILFCRHTCTFADCSAAFSLTSLRYCFLRRLTSFKRLTNSCSSLSSSCCSRLNGAVHEFKAWDRHAKGRTFALLRLS